MAAMKTPGVYIVEKNAFPNSVVEVATAVPAFIGYTERALDKTESLINKPLRISSMGEYQTYFGGAPTPKYTVKVAVKKEVGEVDVAKDKTLNVVIPYGESFEIEVSNEHTLYYNLRLFFANGGGPCYIVSIGSYNDELKSDNMVKAFIPLEKEMEPTMIVIPEAIALDQTECIKVQQAMLSHCGYTMRNRFAILDVYMGKYLGDTKTYVSNFRTAIGTNFLNYGAAYYPWIETSVLSDSDISLDNIVWGKEADIIALLLAVKDKGETLVEYFKDKTKLTIDVPAVAEVIAQEEVPATEDTPLIPAVEGVAAVKAQTKEKAPEQKAQDKIDLHFALMNNWASYPLILKAIKGNINLLPPSAAMAGLYTMVDNTRGVWKAPANISVNNVIKPNLNITNADQEDLNVPLNGKAVNAIRSFIGEGVKVWGARTLDGNSLDWRYINVRRTMIFLEESVKNAARAYVFEPNVSSTWLNMKCMIDNFLRSVWKRGGLAGATPEDAYSVHVGLGDTMTGEDILEGIMRITVLVAISRPAEFIEITFQQQMQKS